MTILALVLVALALVASVLVVRQHLYYLHARRNFVEDRQPLLYSPAAFHVVTFFELLPGHAAIEDLRKFKAVLDATGSAKIVYAGQGVLNAVESAQLPRVRWDAVVLTQYDSRKDYAAVAASEAYRRACEGFAQTYSHGMQRWQLPNLAIPTVLLGIRAIDIVTGVPPHHPFVPAPADRDVPAWRKERSEADTVRLEAAKEFGAKAVVVVNLLKGGTKEQRAADRAYGRKMAGLFAEGRHGPMHIGTAVRVEGEAEFGAVAIVYYPGVEYIRQLQDSTFFAGIEADKQPGDSLAVATVPILSRL